VKRSSQPPVPPEPSLLPDEPDAAERAGVDETAHDTLEEHAKLAGRRRPPPRRGMEAIVDPAAPRMPALVVGALPAHVEVLPETAGLAAGRGDVQVARVHPALVAALGSPLVVGDRITVAALPGGQLLAVEARPRASVMVRPEVDRGRTPQPLVANAQTLWIVVAVAEPEPRAGLIDRFLVAAAAGGFAARLCVTKCDRGVGGELERWLRLYDAAGVGHLHTSVRTGEGLASLRSELSRGFSVLVGHSGVGKSSLVRAILPGEPIAVAESSTADRKGRHTTTVTRYYGLPEGGAVVDTPGLRELGLWNATRSHLDAAFPDLAALGAECRFDDCRHEREPGCAVRAATESGALPAERLGSYRKLGEEIDLRARPGFGRPGGPRG